MLCTQDNVRNFSIELLHLAHHFSGVFRNLFRLNDPWIYPIKQKFLRSKVFEVTQKTGKLVEVWGDYLSPEDNE